MRRLYGPILAVMWRLRAFEGNPEGPASFNVVQTALSLRRKGRFFMSDIGNREEYLCCGCNRFISHSKTTDAIS